MEDYKIKELIDLVKSINVDEFHNDITDGYSYENLLEEIKFLKNKVKNDHFKSEAILDHITTIASGDLSKSIEIINDDSIIDAISMGINVFTEELRESTISVDEYKDTLDALPYVIWASNTDFSEVLYVNESVKDVFGVTSTEMLSNKNLWVDLIHPEDRKYVEDKFDEFFETGYFDVKYRLIKPSGEEVWILDQAKFLLDRNGNKYRIVGICKDITAQELLNIQNQIFSKKLEEAQRISKIGSWEFDLQTKDVLWSKELFSIFEIDKSLKGEELFEAYLSRIHTDDIDILNNAINLCITEGKKYDIKYRIVIAEKIKYIRVIGEPNIVDGTVVGLSGTAQEITEIEKKEQLYKESKENLEDAQAIAKIGSWEFDLKNYNLSWSKEHFRLFEIDENTLAENLYEVYKSKIHPEDLQFIDDKIAYTLETGLPFTYVHRALLSDNRIKWIRGIGNPILNNQNEIVKIKGTAQDITEEIEKQNEISKFKAEIQSFFDLSSDFMAIVSNQGIFEQVNNTFENKLGYKKDEIIGHPVLKLIHPEDQIDVIQDFQNTENDLEITKINRELRYLTKDGETVWISFRVVIDRIQNKHYISGRDVTLQRIKDQELKDALNSVQEYKHALDQIAIVSTSDRQGNIISANDKFVEISGYSYSELIGQNHRIVNSGMHDKSFFEEIWKTITSGEPWRGEICNRKKNGELYWVDSLIVPYVDENNKPLWYFSIRYDITDKKAQENLAKLNLELKKEKELAEQKTRLKERFLANMSHEIRTPMNSILGLSNLMEKVGTLNPKQMDYIKTIKLNSKNLLNIINDILDLSKIEEGKLELETSLIDIREIVTNTVKTLTLTAHKKKVDLISEIDSNLPKLVLGDSTRLNQVILNLTNNAIKFTDEGSVTIRVVQKNKEADRINILFEIIDTGIGIDPSKVDKIFEPFTQEKTSTTRLYGGTGLGLTISNQIINAFGSQIEVKSKVGEGSVFFFEIEFQFVEENIIEQTHNEEIIEDIPSLSGNYSILLVEDNPFNQMVAEDTLKDWYGEFTIEIADNGRVALEKLQTKVYDLVLMDIQMPELDGHEATKIARNELNVLTPILAMTAQATPSEIEACIQSGMNDYISKPFDEQKLYSTITKWLLNNRI